MPNQQAESPQTQVQSQTPAPVTITPELLKTHSITDDEYVLIEKALWAAPRR